MRKNTYRATAAPSEITVTMICSQVTKAPKICTVDWERKCGVVSVEDPCTMVNTASTIKTMPIVATMRQASGPRATRLAMTSNPRPRMAPRMSTEISAATGHASPTSTLR